jgi:RNA polymerase sigma-70 factor (ECF subfamily)
MTPAPVPQSQRVCDENFRSIVREFAPRLLRQANSILGDSEEAASAVQEIFLNVHRSLGEFRGDCALSTWVYRIALNTLLSFKRRPQHHALQPMDSCLLTSVIDEDGDIEAAYNRKEECDRLARCIARLSPRESAAITLFYMDGYEYKEIASMMETSISSVGLLLHRGREHLRHLLTGKNERGPK